MQWELQMHIQVIQLNNTIGSKHMKIRNHYVNVGFSFLTIDLIQIERIKLNEYDTVARLP